MMVACSVSMEKAEDSTDCWSEYLIFSVCIVSGIIYSFAWLLTAQLFYYILCEPDTHM